MTSQGNNTDERNNEDGDVGNEKEITGAVGNEKEVTENVGTEKKVTEDVGNEKEVTGAIDNEKEVTEDVGNEKEVTETDDVGEAGDKGKGIGSEDVGAVGEKIGEENKTEDNDNGSDSEVAASNVRLTTNVTSGFPGRYSFF